MDWRRLKRIDDEKHLGRPKGTLSADGRKYRRHCAEAAQLTLILTSRMFSRIIQQELAEWFS